MLFFLFNQNKLTRIYKAWNDYYPISAPRNNYSKKTFNFQSLNITSTGNAYVCCCYFYDLSAYDGGAILYCVNNSYFLVEKCSVYKCKAINYTAGIRVTGGNCIIAYVCSQYGYADEGDGFCSTSTDTSRTINSVFDSSISHCETKSYNTMYHKFGHVYIKSVNLSHNKANYCSALHCLPNKINEETNHGSDVLYCSFSNNTATSQKCVIVDNQFNTSCTHGIKNCNIIENNSSNTICSRGKLEIISSFISGNKNPCFYTYAQTIITLSNCSVDNMVETGPGSITSSGSPTFILQLTFISSNDCWTPAIEKSFPQYFSNFVFKKPNNYLFL